MKANIIGVRKSCLGACVMTDGEFYTSVAESIDPGAAVDFINRYFAMLFRPVFEHGGFVADLKGDGMLAVWADAASAAELKWRACIACLDIAEHGRQFARGYTARGFGTRVGASFGPLALATLGTPVHNEYRAVGDTVNISSRIEQLNKELGTRILVCSNLAEGVPGLLFRDLGEFQLRGKLNRVHVYELLCREDASSARQRALCEQFAPALADYRRGDFERATDRLQDLCARFPDDGPSRYYLRLCERTGDERRAAARYREAIPTAAALAL